MKPNSTGLDLYSWYPVWSARLGRQAILNFSVLSSTTALCPIPDTPLTTQGPMKRVSTGGGHSWCDVSSSLETYLSSLDTTDSTSWFSELSASDSGSVGEAHGTLEIVMASSCLHIKLFVKPRCSGIWGTQPLSVASSLKVAFEVAAAAQYHRAHTFWRN